MYDDFGLTDEQLAIQNLARKFTQEHIRPIAADVDREQDVVANFPFDMIKEAHKIGLKTLALPEEYGGEDIGAQTRAIISDEMAFADSTCCKIITQMWSNSHRILRRGTKDQFDRFLTRFRDEPTYMICNANTGPHDDKTLYGSPEGGVQLSAEKKGNGYVLNGTKHMNSLGGVASLFTLTGRIDKTLPPKEGTGMFLIPRETEGFQITKIHDRVGWRAYQSAEIVLQDVYVPQENLLGFGAEGGTSSGRNNPYHLIEIGANYAGLARAAYEASLEYAKIRVQGGKPIIEHQYVSEQIADMYIDLQAARSFVWQTATAIDDGKDVQEMAIACCYFAGNVARKVTQTAISVHGGMGVEKELSIERYARDALIAIVTAMMGSRKVRLMYKLGGLDPDGNPKS
jgi:alkylation response protein AidB-like acyl-CoA dehydrogenase